MKWFEGLVKREESEFSISRMEKGKNRKKAENLVERGGKICFLIFIQSLASAKVIPST